MIFFFKVHNASKGKKKKKKKNPLSKELKREKNLEKDKIETKIRDLKWQLVFDSLHGQC